MSQLKNQMKTKETHFIFCLDDSGSMQHLDGGSNTRWSRLMEAVQTFI